MNELAMLPVSYFETFSKQSQTTQVYKTLGGGGLEGVTAKRWLQPLNRGFISNIIRQLFRDFD